MTDHRKECGAVLSLASSYLVVDSLGPPNWGGYLLSLHKQNVRVTVRPRRDLRRLQDSGIVCLSYIVTLQIQQPNFK
jgi:hypothetical protein